MVTSVIALWILIMLRITKAIAEEQIAGRVTPEMLAALCLYGLSSAHATLRALNIMTNVMNVKNRFLVASTLVVIFTAGRNVRIAKRYPDTAL